MCTLLIYCYLFFFIIKTPSMYLLLSNILNKISAGCGNTEQLFQINKRDYGIVPEYIKVLQDFTTNILPGSL